MVTRMSWFPIQWDHYYFHWYFYTGYIDHLIIRAQSLEHKKAKLLVGLLSEI